MERFNCCGQNQEGILDVAFFDGNEFTVFRACALCGKHFGEVKPDTETLRKLNLREYKLDL